eukprot:TRINITY_DN3185_c0_g2_i1.p1 TRINITY_DN3185_c0_g2~~TRINITY_DN3185_c0_g2_i1.p1  ORF type:complete len:203 (-),score=3.54 TRINITY_DN3185_c0_g2_i1:3-611(-)
MSKCISCEEKFDAGESIIKVNQKIYHDSCFRCVECDAALVEIGYLLTVEENPKPICKDCYLKPTLPSCGICRQPVTEPLVTRINDVPFHTKCLQCKNCLKELSDDTQISICNGEWYCLNCLPVPRCEKCNKPIETQALKVMDRLYHAECFKCNKCLELFTATDGMVLEPDGQARHEHCVNSSASSRNLGATISPDKPLIIRP